MNISNDQSTGTPNKTILILDFGSQLTQVIARRLRELGFYSEVKPFWEPLERIQQLAPAGIVLSGGPSSVLERGAPTCDVRALLQIAPVMGVCYGMQLLAHQLGGVVRSSNHREYGSQIVHWEKTIAAEIPPQQKVWMSHGDVVESPPPGFSMIAQSADGIAAAMEGPRAFAVQFHPEVSHTENGAALYLHFAKNICGIKPTWTPHDMLIQIENGLKSSVDAGKKILCALSGGVDSSVVAVLLTRAFGAERVICSFVDTGLLRKHEFEEVSDSYHNLGLNVTAIDGRAHFLKALEGIHDPETKRKRIGHLFIELFEVEVKKHEGIEYLAQGTLYPDVIESVSAFGGPSQTIKSHHNVGGLPERMNLKLIEPLRLLFKDEVRKLGAELGIPAAILGRHPFPGPGLAIRILGDVTEDKLRILKDADHVFMQKLKDRGLYHKIWQAFVVLLPIKTVGVQGDGRTYESVASLRAVTSQDGMTADWYPFEFDFLREVSNAITNQVKGISRVVYDVTSKPPATIEWE